MELLDFLSSILTQGHAAAVIGRTDRNRGGDVDGKGQRADTHFKDILKLDCATHVVSQLVV